MKLVFWLSLTGILYTYIRYGIVLGMLLLVSSALLARNSAFFAVLSVVQAISWVLAIIGGRYKIPVVNRIAGPANALLVLNAAAVVGLYKFLFTRAPLWKIWATGNAADAASPSIT